MKLCRLIIIPLLAFCLTVSAYAANEVPEFYTKSLADDLPGRNGDLSDIEKEIKDQAKAVLRSLSVDADKALADFSLDNAVKMAVCLGSSTAEDAVALDEIYTVILECYYNSGYDIYNSRFLDYMWQIPVAETENHYVFATLIIRSADDISMSICFTEGKDNPNITYLFDREFVSDILKESGLNVNYELMIPINLPSLYTDIVIFEADGVMYGIPLSFRDDLLGAESGKIYKLDELNGKANEFIAKNNQVASGELSSGGSVSTDTEQPSKSPNWSAFVLPTVVTVAVACLVYWGIDRKTRNKHR